MQDRQSIAAAAEVVLRKATDQLVARQNEPLSVSRKELRDVVTEADLASERMLIDGLSAITPTAAILAEESGVTANTGTNRWIIDPLDGTVNYASGLPWFSGTVAYQEDGETVIGLTHGPRVPFFAKYIKGLCAEIDGSPARVSNVDRLDDAVVSVVITSHFNDEEVARVVRIVEALGKKARGVRTICSGSLEMTLVASGKTSGYIGIKSDAVSHAATMPLVVQGGGLVTNENGAPASDFDPIRIASNGRIHNELLDIVNAVIAR